MKHITRGAMIDTAEVIAAAAAMLATLFGISLVVRSFERIAEWFEAKR